MVKSKGDVLPLAVDLTVELAQKFDLSLPQMAEVKAALDKNDATALEKALVGYLNSKLPPLKYQ